MAILHAFNPKVAKVCGIPAAVIFHYISSYVGVNARNGRNFHDGRYWSYNSLNAFTAEYEYMTVSQIRTALDKLEAEGLILTGNFNKNPYDRTKWYALTDKALAYYSNIDAAMDLSKLTNGTVDDDRPIPVNNPVNNTDIPPNTRYSIGYDKETSYGREETEFINLPECKEYLVSPPTGDYATAHAETPKKRNSDIPFEEIRDLYNTICTSLPKCRTVTDKRKAAIRARWSEGFKLPDFEEAFKAAQESKFLKGLVGNRRWRADFDFLVSPKMVKVLEGAYSGEIADDEILFGFGKIGGADDGSDGSYKQLGEYEF